jgi:hypothetical protein
MLAPVTHIVPLAAIERTRLLPVKGEVIVRSGQKVNATDVVARAILEPQHVVVDVARGLGLPPEEAAQHVEREVGDRVSADSILAKHGGLLPVEVRAPCDGRIVVISGGQVLIRVANEPFELLAGIPGTVLDVKVDEGVVIGTTGTWIQGIWGNGQVNYGTLNVLADSPEHVLTVEMLDVSQRGSMMFAGHCNDRKALEMALKIPLRGLILGSLATNLLPVAARMTFPLMILDGFGNIPVNEMTFNLLTTNAGREIAINAEPFDRFKGNRPEVIIPLPASGGVQTPMSADHFEVGKRVRVVRAPLANMVGLIESLPPDAVVFPSGLRLPAASVEFDDGNKELVPLANLEVLG